MKIPFTTSPTDLPGDIKERLERGRARMMQDAPKVNECIEMWRGNQYAYVDGNNNLVQRGVAPGSAKPAHRIRTTRNLILDVVTREVSAANQRIPGYQVVPANTDFNVQGAASLAEKVARYGYDEWKLKTAFTDLITYCVVADEGFVRPFWNTAVGQSVQVDPQTSVNLGEVEVRVYGRNQVYWEPGVRFEDSRWHCVEQGLTPETISHLTGAPAKSIVADGKRAEAINAPDPSKTKLAILVEYLERPSQQYPQGRRLFVCNNKVLLTEDKYPRYDHSGEVIDEPCLHPLAYFRDPDSDRDMGLVRHLVDPQRTYNDTISKVLEWKNLALIPQLLAPKGSLQTDLDDEPGKLIEYLPMSGLKPEWKQTPQIPPELFTILNQTKGDIAQIVAQNDIPSQIESGKAIQALIERDQTRRQEFVSRLSSVHASVMSHCLQLVQCHYTENRLLTIQGPLGIETVGDFQGANLKGQCSVIVLPSSIESRTREGIRTAVFEYADRGWITPEQAMAAIDGGVAENLIESYENQISKQQREILRILALDKTLDPNVQPDHFAQAGIPIPARFDNDPLHKQVLEQYMTSADFERQPLPVQQILEWHYDAHSAQQDKKAADAAMQQQQTAASLGMANAARPQGTPPPAPSMPSSAGREAKAAGQNPSQ